MTCDSECCRGVQTSRQEHYGFFMHNSCSWSKSFLSPNKFRNNGIICYMLSIKPRPCKSISQRRNAAYSRRHRDRTTMSYKRLTAEAVVVYLLRPESREKRSPAKNAKRPILAVPQNKRSREGSNLRPTDPQSVALSTELRDHPVAVCHGL